MRALARWMRYPLEGAAVWLAFYLLKLLSLDRASALGGALGRAIGPRLAVSRRAVENLGRAMPELDQTAIAGIVGGMWENLGRVAAEYPHLASFKLYDGDGRVEVIGAEHVDALRDDGIGGIFFSAHLGNWELASLGATQRGLALIHVYRAANNPLVERLVRRARRAVEGTHWAKGKGSARELVAALRAGEHLGTLTDQKLREGLAVPFFGIEAMTQPIVGQLGARFRCPVVPARVERLEGARFRLTIGPPLAILDSGDRDADALAALVEMNRLIEGWIRARPEQWFWLHRRWPE